MKQKIVKLKFVKRTLKNEKIVERLQMSRFLLHLLIYLRTLFFFSIESHKIEHIFKTHEIKVKLANLYSNLILHKNKQIHPPPPVCT